MLKFLIISNVVVTNICCILFAIVVIDGYVAFRTKHPDFTGPERQLDSESILGIIKFALMTICPIYNILVMIVLAISRDDIINKIVHTIEEEYLLSGGVE